MSKQIASKKTKSSNELCTLLYTVKKASKKIFNCHYYKFDTSKYGNPKGCTKYFLTLNFFAKWQLNFRIGNQAGGWYFRNEELYSWWITFTGNDKLPF